MLPVITPTGKAYFMEIPNVFRMECHHLHLGNTRLEAAAVGSVEGIDNSPDCYSAVDIPAVHAPVVADNSAEDRPVADSVVDRRCYSHR